MYLQLERALHLSRSFKRAFDFLFYQYKRRICQGSAGFFGATPEVVVLLIVYAVYLTDIPQRIIKTHQVDSNTDVSVEKGRRKLK